ncbi:MAG: glycosyl transferase [Thermodesulfobacteriota bacterium]
MKLMHDNPRGVAYADLAVGILGSPDLLSIALEQIDRDLCSHYPGRSLTLICCNGKSDESARQTFMDIPTASPKIYLEAGNGHGGNCFELLLQQVVELGCQAAVAIEAERLASSYRFIRNLFEPLFQNYDFVSPLYLLRKYSGPFTSNLVYPLVRSLYGRRIRQPLGDELGFSGRMAALFHESERIRRNSASSRVWVTTTAMKAKALLIQSYMGNPRPELFPAASEGEVKRVLQSVFELMCRHEGFWLHVKWSKPTAVFGVRSESMDSNPTVDLDVSGLRDLVFQRLAGQWGICRTILAGDNLDNLERFLNAAMRRNTFSPSLWAKIVYDAAVSFKRQVVREEDLLDALLTLYYAKTLSFVLETEAMSVQQVEVYTENQCLVFEQFKPYLVERWTERQL